MTNLNHVIDKILEEVDADIREVMLAETNSPRYSGGPMYKTWELLPDPASAILSWQLLRQRKAYDRTTDTGN